MSTFVFPKAEQTIEELLSKYLVGSCTNKGITLYPSPCSNFCNLHCIANSLNKQNIHIIPKAHTAVLNFLIITNFIKAPATIIEIKSFKNHASWMMGPKKSMMISINDKMRPVINAIFGTLIHKANISWEYKTKQAS